jgi:hypothetical protein
MEFEAKSGNCHLEKDHRHEREIDGNATNARNRLGMNVTI